MMIEKMDKKDADFVIEKKISFKNVHNQEKFFFLFLVKLYHANKRFNCLFEN